MHIISEIFWTEVFGEPINELQNGRANLPGFYQIGWMHLPSLVSSLLFMPLLLLWNRGPCLTCLILSYTIHRYTHSLT